MGAALGGVHEAVLETDSQTATHDSVAVGLALAGNEARHTELGHKPGEGLVEGPHIPGDSDLLNKVNRPKNKEGAEQGEPDW